MNVPCAAQRHTFHGIGFALLGILILPAFSAGHPAPIANTGGNNPPHAITGPNQKIGVHPNVLAVPTLDGSQSFDPDFDPITYQWKAPNGMVIGTGPTVQVTIAFLGTYTYTLTVCDTHINTQGQTLHACASTSTTVEVVLDLRPPVVDAPDITVSITEPGGARGSASTPLANYILTGATTSAVDDVDLHPHFLRVVTNGVTADANTLFPEGDTPVNVFYADQAGNVGTSAATIHVVDRQDGDIFIATNVDCCTDGIQRIRGGAVENLCITAGTSFGTQGIILDSSGRVVALRNNVNLAGTAGLEMVRCNVKGAPPEKFAFFQWAGGLPAGYPEPFPGLHVIGNPFGVGGGGLTLARLREVIIDDHQNSGLPFIIEEDAYMFDLSLLPYPSPSGNANIYPMQPVTYHVKQNFWEYGSNFGASLSGGPSNNPPSMYFHSGTTFAAGGGCLDRIKIPLSIHATGQLGGVNFNLQLGLFGSSGEICGLYLNDVTIPDMAICPQIPGMPPPNPAPTDGNAIAIMDSFGQVFFDDFNGHGLTLVSGSFATVNGILTNFSTLPLDSPGDPANFFGNPFLGCANSEQDFYKPLYYGPYLGGPITPTQQGFLAMSGSNGPAGNSLVEVTTGAPRVIVNGGLGNVAPVTAWPPNVSAGFAISVLIRIDSPVDVLVTDPNGKKLGMENGVPVNDFGADGSDTGAASHPRFYAINNPVPGDYIVQSVGTGTGPYTVHVYSVDTSKPFGQHILSSGNATPGALSSQNFTFGAGGGIVFTNHPPTAIAGPDQTVNAAANGTAPINLDGTASSDPDGDPLTFTWAGPFGAVYGAKPQVTMPVGVNVLQLIVDDGKGGTASANVTITVNPPPDTTPPVLTLPASFTVPATSASGAMVTYVASAIDNVDGPVTPVCSPASGANFPIGTTTVNCTATDAAGNPASGSFTVTVSVGAPRISGRLLGKGVQSPGVLYVDVQLTNTGTGHARNLGVTKVLLRALSGTGAVSYNAALSSVLPVALGSLNVGASITARFYLNVSATVTRFSITENGTVQGVTGTSYSYSTAQSVIP